MTSATHAGTRVLAVDLGATSVRVAEVDLAALPPRVTVLHRWPHGPVRQTDGSLRWDWDGIVREVRRGLDAAIDAGPVASIGVDGWGVDYGLIDADGRLLELPYSYRDARTDSWHDIAATIGPRRLYAQTGIQLMPINTIFQLAAHDRSVLDRAAQFLLLPDLLVHDLTGYIGTERSNASTTALVDASTGTWSGELLDAIGLPALPLPPIAEATTFVGTHRDVPVHLVGSHDTASAVAAVPGVPGPRSAFVSSGTWVLVGAERPAPDTSEAARAANFSNELGVTGGVRFLKNVMGFWMLEQCRDAWGRPTIEQLVADAETVTEPVTPIDATDDRFLAPPDMEREISEAAGLGSRPDRAMVTRVVLESIASATARVVDEIGTLTGAPVDELFVVGGAVRMDLMNRLYARHTGLPVHVGSAEATALGNALVQGIALGLFPDLTTARKALTSTRTVVTSQ